MDILQAPFASLAPNLTHVVPTSDWQTHHILTGSFRSLSLYLLAFSSVPHSASHHLSLVQSIPAYGPHQYLARNKAGTRVYTTSWADPPILSSWEVERPEMEGDGASWNVKHLANTFITAVSSYIAFSPTSEAFVYSTGGPCGEVHTLDHNGIFETKAQEFLFNGISSDDLHSGKVDTSRKALRVGSHGIEFSRRREVTLAFIPHLTPSEIVIYTVDEQSGHLHLVESTSPPSRIIDGRLDEWDNDGPRHVKIHPNGNILYCVTEHSNYLDLYTISYSPTPSLIYHSSQSLIPPQSTLPSSSSESHDDHTSNSHPFDSDRKTRHDYRGDTLILPPTASPSAIFATTRGASSSTKGWVLTAPLDDQGFFASSRSIEYWQTPTSGGKANALDIIPRRSRHPQHSKVNRDTDNDDSSWLLLTDDDEESVVANGGSGVHVLAWDGFGTGGLKLVASWPSPLDTGEEKPVSSRAASGERMQGGSHAIWLD